MSSALSGLFLILVAGFLIQIPVYSRRLGLHLQAAARFPIVTLLLGFAINIAVRLLELLCPLIGGWAIQLASSFGGFLGPEAPVRLGTMYLSLVCAPVVGFVWMAVEYTFASRRIRVLPASNPQGNGSGRQDTSKSGLWQRWMTLRHRVHLQITSESIGLLHGLLVRAMRENIPVMLTLRSGKVYVGAVVDMGKPESMNLADTAIRILPARSGYRDKDTKKVKIQTDYTVALSALSARLSPDTLESRHDNEKIQRLIGSIGQYIRISDLEVVTLHDEDLAALFKSATGGALAPDNQARMPADV